MNPRILSLGAVLPLAAASVLVGTSQAQAASLTGAGSIGFSGSVRVFGQIGEEGELATSFDFIPPESGSPFESSPEGFGGFIVGEDTADGGFSEFAPTTFPPTANSVGTGVQEDVTVQELEGDVFTLSPPGPPVEDFVVLEGGDMEDTTFTLETIESATFEGVNGDLTTTIQVGGTFISNGETFEGSGIYTAQLEAVTEEEFLAGLAAGEVFTETYSADYIAVAAPGEVEVPEPTSLLGLAAALGLAASSLRKQKEVS